VYTGEAIFGMISLFLRDYAPLEQRVRAATARMAAIPDLLAAGRANIPAAPRAWIERAINECTAADALFTDGTEVLRDRHGVVDPEFHSAAAIARRAFHEFREYLSGTLLNDAHDVYACGREPLDMLIRLGHALDSDAEAIEAYARRRMSEALEDLTEGAARLDSSRGWREQLDALADIHPTIEEYYSAYSREFDAAREFAIEHELVTWPDYPIRFEPIPDWARTSAPTLYFLFYRAAAAFDSAIWLLQSSRTCPRKPRTRCCAQSTPARSA
jgi:hypothetical protein